MAYNCLFCQAVLDESANPKEHIIPNSIGGRLKSRMLTCSTCNSTFGQDCDTALAISLNFFANFLDIKRERGEPQSVKGTAPNETYLVQSGGKPSLTKPEIIKEDIGNGKQKITIKARDIKEARTILEGMKRKNPSLDVEKALAAAVPVREYIQDYVTFNLDIGGPDVLRAVAKILYLFGEYKSPGLMQGSPAVANFIKGTADYRKIYFYYPPKPLVAPSADQVLHALIIKSYPSKKLLMGYVELFGVASFICVLSDNFTEFIEFSYVFDVIERTEIITPQIHIPSFTKIELTELFKRLTPPFDEVKKRFYRFLRLTSKRQTLGHLNDLAQRAIEKSFMMHPEGEPVTEKMVQEFLQAYEVELADFMASKLPDNEGLEGDTSGSDDAK